MRVIPEAVQTLLKSRSMIGANSPNHNVVITGAPGDVGLLDPESWTTWRTFIGSSGTPRTYGNMVETSDGRAVISYAEDDKIYVAFANTVAGILAGTESFGAGTLIYSTKPYVQSSLNLIDGKLHLVITYWDSSVPGPSLCAQYWRDSDGRGTDFAYVSTISTTLSYNYSWHDPMRGSAPGHVQKLSDNNYVVVLPWYDLVSSMNIIYYSNDAGDTWTQGAGTISWLGAHMNGASVSILPVDDSSFILHWEASDQSNRILYYTNYGATLSDSPNYGTGWGTDMPRGVAYCKVGSEFYMAAGMSSYNCYIYKLKTDTITSYTDMDDFDDWELVAQVAADGTDSPQYFVLTESALVLQHDIGNVISGAGTTAFNQSLRAKRIEVTRNRGMASSLSIAFDNKNGYLSPDIEGEWHEVLFPNAGIYVEQGYGSELVRTFTGLLDDTQEDTFPAEITLLCRDYLKRALDKTITNSGAYSITYTNKSPEYIFNDLATKAGFTSVTTDASGLVIAEKTFSNETYADAFSWLADIAGYIWYCDENGALYFYDDTQPVTTSSYTFSEGEDIISLGYKISDRDLYYKVVVLGNGVSAEAYYVAADYYNIPSDKIQFLQASEATTVEECQAIADRAEIVMRSRARVCDFAAVAVPWLQIGDCVTINETTTGISEVYRITDMTLTQTPDGFIMQITCYHYAEVL